MSINISVNKWHVCLGSYRYKTSQKWDEEEDGEEGVGGVGKRRDGRRERGREGGSGGGCAAP